MLATAFVLGSLGLLCIVFVLIADLAGWYDPLDLGDADTGYTATGFDPDCPCDDCHIERVRRDTTQPLT